MSEFNGKIGVIGIGFVGSAMVTSMISKNICVKQYDKFKNLGTLEDMMDCSFLFLCLPTPYSNSEKQYDKSAIYEVCEQLKNMEYGGIVIIKSTVEIGTTKDLYKTYGLLLIHCPEFLSQDTALYDINNQVHIVIGKVPECDCDISEVLLYFKTFYDAPISICTCDESESMKLFCNSFYSVKLQFFSELYMLCDKMDISYNKVRDMMVANGWLNKMHTNVPGKENKISYGGYCFPKDTQALRELMKREGTINAVLSATIEERNLLRDDHLNCI